MPAVSEGRPTIRDVAERAGVSKSLVSLVLRNSPKVSEERRALVRAAIDEMGYEMNLAARSLATRDNKTVGVLVSDLHNPWAFDVADAARNVLEDADHTVLFSAASSSRTGAVDTSTLQAYRDLRVSGLLVVGSVPDTQPLHHAAGGGPVVFAGGGPDIENADVVRSDDASGIEMVVDHLVEQGHRRIAHLGGQGGSAARERESGYRAAMHRHGLDAEILVYPATYSTESGYTAAQSALDTTHRPTALVCVNDLAALGAMTAADEVNYDVAITGYDNIAIVSMPRLSLTTVDPDSQTLGVLGARTLLRRVTDKEPEEGFFHDAIPPHLVVRDSSRHGMG
ncbi:LacI family transcriptional regulator [Arthrobacter sp. 9AX]|uniref:LacI family DNA-binding transcriptional regulator n=1 Tax=Arthrobacter sp. 9AX TaxID=2653131 RepID=UPI0012F3AF3D|nr:LacI family DNA-binding transcriptional regulator [Arthrobacter sp. 9AX]VXB05018.1 LacI family transcriptional regulator [Arthrobacter sp. 9AX]